jgi:hypothetical protein
VRQGHRHVERIAYSYDPENNPVNAYTMAGIVKDAGITIEQFKQFLGIAKASLTTASFMSAAPPRGTTRLLTGADISLVKIAGDF